MDSLTAQQQEWVAKLKSPEYGQSHLLENCDQGSPSDIKRLIDQIERLDATYPGGLLNYIKRARALLADSKNCVNPFEGYTPEVPLGKNLEPGTPQFSEFEKKGLPEIAKCCFVLVAGGLGERLGYPDIKIGLPCDVTSDITYMELYARTILAAQTQARKTLNNPEWTLPLAIMTSGDTNEKTVELLESNGFFGLQKSQVTVMLQEKVPALLDNDARMAVKSNDKFEIETKPHGHGDVHVLLKQHDLPKKWASEGRQWVIFFQDTNGLVFRALASVLGVSKELNLTMNSITVPRKPGEAVGGICKLTKPDGTSLTINVEYNLLNPLLLSTGDKKGDVPHEGGNSKFPGNINVLIFNVPRYAAILEASGGTVPEFVNPKYKDETKTTFKSPTRLECMMQDLPRLFEPQDNVGVTQLSRWLCFSTVKNNSADASIRAKQGLPAESAFSGESDQYFAAAKILELAAQTKCSPLCIAPPKPVSFLDIPYQLGPRIVLMPSFGISLECTKQQILGGKLCISERSTLVIEGDVKLNGLELDGALILKAAPGKTLTVNNLKVCNDGWHFASIDESKADVPISRKIRGYTLEKKESTVLLAE